MTVCEVPKGLFSNGRPAYTLRITPLYKRHYSPGQLQFITISTYRRAPLFLSERFRRCFVETLAHLRQEMRFRLVGWVLMPDHFHLLPNPAERDCGHRARHREAIERADGHPNPQAAARRHQPFLVAKMLACLSLPPTGHDESHHPFWQRRFYPFNVYSERKRLEKLDYMHQNPVKRS